jgi:hypothetical protein
MLLLVCLPPTAAIADSIIVGAAEGSPFVALSLAGTEVEEAQDFSGDKRLVAHTALFLSIQLALITRITWPFIASWRHSAHSTH